MSLRVACRLAVTGLLILSMTKTYRAQEDPAIDHARRILELLHQKEFAEAAMKFNSQMTAALPVEQLGGVWEILRSQVGDFESVTDQHVTNTQGVTAVTLECQFERAPLNVIVTFDAEDKIAGLRFVTPQTAITPPSGPSSDRFSEEPVVVGGEEWALPGTISLPSDGNGLPALVLVHGSGPHDRDATFGPNKPFRDLAWGLAERGIAVLRYEKRTREHQARVGQDITVWEETIEDVLFALEVLRAHDRIDADRVFVLGHSLGGTLAPRIGVEDSRTAGLVIMAGTTRPLPELMIEQAEYIASLSSDSVTAGAFLEDLRQQADRIMDPDLPLDTPASQLLGASAAYWKDLNGYEPAEVARSLEIPMLILQGERDYQVTLRDLDGWREAVGNRSDVTLKSYPLLNHLFISGEGQNTPSEYQREGNVSDSVIGDIADWVKAH